MKNSIGTWLSDTIRFLLLRGSGWQRRRRPEGVAGQLEWQDPSSGHWYSERQALRILHRQALAEYDRSGPSRRHSHLRC
jgi:hypothetical protein